MKLFSILSVLATLPILTSCTKQHDEFVGTWGNEWMGGTVHFVVTKDGSDSFIVKEVLLENGAIISTSVGKVVNDQLVLNDGTGLFGKFAYSPSENALVVINQPTSPIYRRVATLTASDISNAKKEIDVIVKPAFVATGTACSTNFPGAPDISNAVLGLPSASSMSGAYIDSVFTGGTESEPTITVTFKTIGNALPAGRTLVYRGVCSTTGLAWTVSGTGLEILNAKG